MRRAQSPIVSVTRFKDYRTGSGTDPVTQYCLTTVPMMLLSIQSIADLLDPELDAWTPSLSIRVLYRSAPDLSLAQTNRRTAAEPSDAPN